MRLSVCPLFPENASVPFTPYFDNQTYHPLTAVE